MIDKERKSNPIIISGKEDKECYEIIKNYWGEILIRTKIEYGISDISFETWLQKLQIAEYREGTLVLRFPEDEMAALYVKKKYEYPLEYIINEMTVTNIKVLKLPTPIRCIWRVPTAGFAEQNGRNAKLNSR